MAKTPLKRPIPPGGRGAVLGGPPVNNAVGGSSTTGPSPAATPSPGSPCLIPMPSLNLAVFSVGGGCLLSKTNVRAIVGGLLLLAGGSMGLVGAVLLAAYGLKASGAARGVGRTMEVAGGALAVVPGAEAAGAGLAAGGAGVRRVGSEQAGQRAVQRRTQRRAAAARADRQLEKESTPPKRSALDNPRPTRKTISGEDVDRAYARRRAIEATRQRSPASAAEAGF